MTYLNDNQKEMLRQSLKLIDDVAEQLEKENPDRKDHGDLCELWGEVRRYLIKHQVKVQDLFK